MSQPTTPSTRTARCVNCGFEAPADAEAWDAVEHPPLGTLQQCPECTSTEILGTE
ncbi:MAG: hypothetical protein ABEH77_10450 [Halobacteriaceae archaeon]